MKYNYVLFRRLARVCLVVLWLATLANLAIAQQRKHVTPGSTGVNTTVSPGNSGWISITPAALHDTLNLDKQATHSLVLTNTSVSSLPFTAVTIPKSFPAFDGTTRVLIVSPEPSQTYIENLFNAYPDVDADILPVSALPGLTSVTLSGYHVVYIYNHAQWSTAGISADHLGDILADYVDNGGKVILNAAAYANDAWGVGGRFKTQYYSPVLPATAVFNEGLALGDIDLPGHPLVNDVDSLHTWYLSYDIDLAPGGYAVAHWANGEILLAANQHVVAFNFMPSRGVDVPVGPPTTGDVGILHHNAVQYLRASAFLGVTPFDGTIPAGGQVTLTATFDATALASGMYTADVVIGNAITGEYAAVPGDLMMTGPAFYTTPDTLSVALKKKQSVTQTLVLHNNSPVNSTFKVKKLPPFVTVSPASGDLPAGASITLKVKFSSGTLPFDTYNGGITFKTGSSLLVTPVSMRVYGNPEIEVNPNVLTETLAYKEESFTTFKIRNTGGNPLVYKMQVIGADAKIKHKKKAPVHKARIPVARHEKEVREAGAREQGRKQELQLTQPLQLFSGIPLLQESFDGPAFPEGWQSVDNSNAGVTWRFAANYAYGNFAGTGEAATVVSELYPDADFDASLITPEVNAAPYKNIVLQYNVNFQKTIGFEVLDLDIQVDGGAWTNIINAYWSYGMFYSLPGQYLTVPLGDYLNANASKFRLRWHYYDPFDLNWGYYAQIDDVVILGEARAWMTIAPGSGTIPVKGSDEIAVHFDAYDHKPGFYVGGVIISSNAGKHPVSGLLATLKILKPAALSIDPDSLVVTLPAGASVAQPLLIGNAGPSPLKYAFGTTALPPRTLGTARHAGTPQYATGFEDLKPGILDGQDGWSDWTHTWLVDTINPQAGKQHLHSESGTRLESPHVKQGDSPISSMRMKLDFRPGNEVRVTPVTTDSHIVTMLNFTARGKLAISAYDTVTTGGRDYIVDVPYHHGYFELRLDAERATGRFTVYIDSDSLFTGKGYQTAGIEYVTISASYMGGSLDVDDFAIYDGPSPRYWVTVKQPTSGIVLSGSTAVHEAVFSTEDLAPGTYRDTLRLSSNDPVKPLVLIPVRLTVEAPDTTAKSVLGRLPRTSVITEDNVSVYPVPVADELRIALPAGQEGGVRISIHDAQGRPMFTDQGDAIAAHTYSVSTSKLHLAPGLYYIHVQYANGMQAVRKFIKE